VPGPGLLSLKSGQIQAVRNDLQPAQTFAAGKRLDQADLQDYGALLLPGGAVNADRLRTEPAMQSVLKQIIRAGQAMTVICHATWGPVPSGRAVTSSHTIQDDLRNARATWADREVVYGNLVTSRQPGGIPAFTRHMVNLFAAARGA
jgi:protease I